MTHKRIQFLFILVTGLALYSCALIKPTPLTLDTNINQWLSENKFDEIDDALRALDKNDSQFKNVLQKKDSIANKKVEYIKLTSASAKKYKDKDQWQKALDTYNAALENIKNETQLKKERNALIIERDEQIIELRKELLLKRANALISYTRIYAKLHQLVPDDYIAQYDINHYEKDRSEVAANLNQCGDQAREKKQYTVARDCYSLSNQLEPATQKSTWVNKLDIQLKNYANKKRYSELLAAYKNAYKKHEYNKAKMHLHTLLAINPAHKQANIYLKSLNKEINEQTQEKIELGKELYSQKKIRQALNLWEQALLLDPENNELTQLINRAEKVSKKIESLESSQ